MFIRETSPYGRRGGWRELLYAGWRIGHVFGIEVRLHLVLLLLIAFDLVVQTIGLARGQTSLADFLLFPVGFWITLLVSVLLHELGHCYGSWIVGAGAHSILLWPLGGLARTEGGSRAPSAELLIVSLGPAVNLILGPLAQGAAWMVASLAPDTDIWRWIHTFLRHAAYVNYGMAAFNLVLPLFPMDSARILRALVSMRIPSSRATYYVTTLGMWIGGVGFLLALLGGGRIVILGFELGGWMAFIFIFGLIESAAERIRVRFGPAYESEVPYGPHPVYTYTSQSWRRTRLIEQARCLARALSSPFRRRPRQGGGGGGVHVQRRAAGPAGDARGSAGSGGVTARVIEIEEAGLPETDRTRYLRRLRDLDSQLKAAVHDEDFDRARRIKEQIAALRAENE